MAKKIKKPRYKALPKAPKTTASLETWRNYERKVNEVVSANMNLKAEYEKKLNALKQIEKMKSDIKNKIASLKSKVPIGTRSKARA